MVVQEVVWNESVGKPTAELLEVCWVIKLLMVLQAQQMSSTVLEMGSFLDSPIRYFPTDNPKRVVGRMVSTILLCSNHTEHTGSDGLLWPSV